MITVRVKHLVRPEWTRQYARILALAWADDGFRQRLIQYPDVVLREFGIEIPQPQKIKVVEVAEDEILLPIFPKPNGKDYVVADFGRTLIPLDCPCDPPVPECIHTDLTSDGCG